MIALFLASAILTAHVLPPIVEARLYALNTLGWPEYRCLDRLVERESGWRVNARNRTSGAYGLGQALPGSKMAKAGPDWRTNPTTQLEWAIEFYIPDRYGTACNAWAFWQRHRWF